jgi:hypothetical protein
MSIVGFWGLGWTTSGTAQRAGQERVDAAVIVALAEACADRLLSLKPG